MRKTGRAASRAAAAANGTVHKGTLIAEWAATRTRDRAVRASEDYGWLGRACACVPSAVFLDTAFYLITSFGGQLLLLAVFAALLIFGGALAWLWADECAPARLFGARRGAICWGLGMGVAIQFHSILSNFMKTLRGSFSTVSKPICASKY